MASRTAFLIASIVIACVCADARVDTQTQSQDVTAALLSEVRALRTTIALAVGAGASGQLALGRLQLQEQRVNAIMTRLETTREKLGESRREALQRRESCKSIEAALTGPSTSRSFHGDDTLSREDLEQMLTTCRAETAAAVSETQRLSEEEAVLAADLLTEQSRWSDLNRRLEEIELALTRSH
jgi:hypothetical protein